MNRSDHAGANAPSGPGPSPRAGGAVELTADLLKAMLDKAPVMIKLKDLNGRFLYVNPAALAGMPDVKDARDMIGRTSADFSRPEKAAVVEAQERAVLQSGRPLMDYEWEFVNRWGKRQWRRLWRIPMRDAQGAIVALMINSQDITAEKLAQAQSAHNQRLLQAVLDNSQEGISLSLRDGHDHLRLILFNPRFVEMSGRTEQELTGPQGFHRFVRCLEAPADRHERQCGLPRRGILSWNRRDGRENYVEWAATAFEVDGQEYVLGVDRDVTAAKQAERALAASEAKYRTLVENAGAVILILDRRGKVLFANTAAASQMGRPAEAVIGHSIWTLMPAPIAQRYCSQIPRALQSGRRRTLVAVAPDQSRNRWYQVAVEPLANPDTGRRDRVMVASQDITELREAELAVQRAREQERQRLAGDLHDSLGQQLALLRMQIQGVLSEAEEALTTEQIRHLAGAAQACAAMVREVRDLCHGLFPRALESLGLPAALRGLARDQGHRVAVSVDCPADMEHRRLGPDAEITLFRAAQEGIGNAVRHGRARRVLLRLRRRADRVRLLVRDDGAGFDTTSVPSGLGLHVMTERTEALGGTLAISSRPGRTEILVEIPVETPGLDQARQSSEPRRTRRAQRTKARPQAKRPAKAKPGGRGRTSTSVNTRQKKRRE